MEQRTTWSNEPQGIDFSNDETVMQLFLDTVPDPVTRAILFGVKVNQKQPNIKSCSMYINRGGIIRVMRSIVSLAYAIALTRWRQLDAASSDEGKSWGYPEHIRDFKEARYSKLFQSALGNEDITLDLQIFSLIELWVGLKKARNLVSGRFGLLFNQAIEGDDIGLTLQRVRDFIRNASFKHNELNPKYPKEECNKLCYKLLDAFMIFRAVKISYPADVRLEDDEDFSIEYDLNPKEHKILYPNKFSKDKFIVTEDQLYRMQARGEGKDDTVEASPRIMLYMLAETSAFNGEIQHIYRSFDGESEARIRSDESSEDAALAEEEAPENDELRETRKFLTFNYKNLRDFALVISDALKNMPRKRQVLFSICKQRFPMIVANVQRYDAPDIYWDNIITLMLVEMGFSDFLEQILDDESIFYNIMKNIGWRCSGRESVERLNQYEQEAAAIEQDAKQSKRSLNAKYVQLRVRKVLQAMKFIEDNDDGLPNPFEENLTSKYDNICNCLNVLKQYKDERTNIHECTVAKKALVEIFSNAFCFLQIFYKGLDCYAKKKIDLMEERPSSGMLMVRGETTRGEDDFQEEDGKAGEREWIKKYRKECLDAFKRGAREQYAKIKGSSLSKLYDGFCAVCEQYNSFAVSGSFNISEEARNLKFLITRNYICDVSKLKFFASIKLANGEESNIFKMLEDFSDKYYTDPSYLEWLDYFRDFFLFLIYNEDYNKKGLWNEGGGKLRDKDCDPIYPYVVSYYSENIDRDQLKKCIYRVPIPTEDSNNEESSIVVTLLTEENYHPGTYFCIPLRYGSSESWWINPFLIPTGVLEDIANEIKLENKKIS